MKAITFILGVVSLVVSFFAFFLIFYFYFVVPEKKINIKNLSIKPREQKEFYDFKNIFKTALNQKKKKETQVVKEKNPSVPLPELKAIYYGKNRLALLRFKISNKEIRDIWVKEGEKKLGWELKEVKPFYVILSADGKNEKLNLFKRNQEKKRVLGKGSERQSFEENGVFIVSKETLRRLTSNIGNLFSQIGLRPYFNRGRIEGVKIIYLKPDSIFTKAGLRRGDVILTINGVPIKTTEDTYRIFESLKTASRIEVKVKRGSRVITLRAEVR